MIIGWTMPPEAGRDLRGLERADRKLRPPGRLHGAALSHGEGQDLGGGAGGRARVGVVGPKRANTSCRTHRRVERFPARRQSQSHESPACRPVVRPFNRDEFARRESACRGGWHLTPRVSHQTAVSKDGRVIDSSPGGDFIRPIGADKIPRACRKSSRCITHRARLVGLCDRIDVFFHAFSDVYSTFGQWRLT